LGALVQLDYFDRVVKKFAVVLCLHMRPSSGVLASAGGCLEQSVL